MDIKKGYLALVVLLVLYLVAKNVDAKNDLTYMIGTGLYEVEATAYCDNEQPTASGEEVRVGICATARELMYKTIAIYDEDMVLMGYWESLDTGGDYRIKSGKCVDIYIPSYEDCIEFGRRKVYIEVIDAEG